MKPKKATAAKAVELVFEPAESTVEPSAPEVFAHEPELTVEHLDPRPHGLRRRRGLIAAGIATICVGSAAVGVVKAMGPHGPFRTVDQKPAVAAEPARPLAAPAEEAKPILAEYRAPDRDEISRAYLNVATVYKTEGLSGVVRQTMDCFGALKSNPSYSALDYCVALDLYGEALQRKLADGKPIPTDSYFSGVEARDLQAAREVVARDGDAGARVFDDRRLAGEVSQAGPEAAAAAVKHAAVATALVAEREAQAKAAADAKLAAASAPTAVAQSAPNPVLAQRPAPAAPAAKAQPAPTTLAGAQSAPRPAAAVPAVKAQAAVHPLVQARAAPAKAPAKAVAPKAVVLAAAKPQPKAPPKPVVRAVARHAAPKRPAPVRVARAAPPKAAGHAPIVRASVHAKPQHMATTRISLRHAKPAPKPAKAVKVVAKAPPHSSLPRPLQVLDHFFRSVTHPTPQRVSQTTSRSAPTHPGTVRVAAQGRGHGHAYEPSAWIDCRQPRNGQEVEICRGGSGSDGTLGGQLRGGHFRGDDR
ncbi:MAG: hypothetical protein JSR45_01940 [Proteobacteria bacterium]|nr:hypothetical protein [Pseudomonadota bacterium]